MSDSLETRLRLKAESLGFTLFGVAPATDADGFDRFTDWLDAGYAGTLDYLHQYREHRRHPRSVRPWVRSVVMLGMEYSSGNRRQEAGGRGQGAGDRGLESEGSKAMEVKTLPPDVSCRQTPDSRPLSPDSYLPTPGRVAAYALGPDYHRYIWDRVNDLSAWLTTEVPGCLAHGVVDTAPILERDFARRAGLGWFGKNTMLINKHRGSSFFLAAFLTDIELSPSPPHEATHCGTCTACLDACPTDAFPEPGVLDARKCVSYLTIELRGPIPEELRPGVGDWLFGCDVCQDVCPWNRSRNPGHPQGVPLQGTSVGAPLVGALPDFPTNPDLLALDPVELLALSPAQFKQRFDGTSLLRARRSGLLRNAAIVLGNTGVASALPALERAALDADEVIRDAATWAISRIRQRCG